MLQVVKTATPGAGERAVDPMDMFDSCMTQRVRAASARYSQDYHNRSSSLLCFSCGCKDGLCFLALTKGSVLRMKQDGRCIKCPMHAGSTSSSKYVASLYDIIRNLNSSVHGVVWDWHDVPADEYSSHRMHIDASMFYGKSCTRFEVDGETHFKDNGTCRDDKDEAKDYVLRKHRVGMLRLHYNDVDKWREYVLCAMQNDNQTVRYTESYTQCLHPDEHQYVIML